MVLKKISQEKKNQISRMMEEERVNFELTQKEWKKQDRKLNKEKPSSDKYLDLELQKKTKELENKLKILTKKRNNIIQLEPMFLALAEGGVEPKKVKTWNDLGYYLDDLNISPQEVFRIVREKRSKDNIKFIWKMIRFTLFIWERVKEHKNGYLKPKIDTAISVIRSRKFENYHYGYFPDIKIDEKKEVRLLNKLIAEKAQRSLFTSGEGYYYYENSSKIIQQDYLDIILSFKKEV